MLNIKYNLSILHFIYHNLSILHTLYYHNLSTLHTLHITIYLYYICSILQSIHIIYHNLIYLYYKGFIYHNLSLICKAYLAASFISEANNLTKPLGTISSSPFNSNASSNKIWAKK